MINAIINYIRFYTRVPMPRAEFNREKFVKYFFLSPLTGYIIGIFTAGAYFAAGLIDNGPIAAFASVAAWAFITGALHIDGLADTFDGFGCGKDREAALSVMKDPHIGTHGVVAIVFIILLKIFLIVPIEPGRAYAYLIVIPALARMAAVWSAGTCRCARADGLGAIVIKKIGVYNILLATILALAISSLIIGTMFFPLGIASIAAALLFNVISRKKIGGITGDTLGACIEISETAMLVTLLAVQRYFSAWIL
jgi:adenosylcobinamide-GDP ribazoletransferase